MEAEPSEGVSEQRNTCLGLPITAGIANKTTESYLSYIILARKREREIGREREKNKGKKCGINVSLHPEFSSIFAYQ